MGQAGYTVVDVDAHYMDHLDEIYEYLDDDDPWKAKFEYGVEVEDSKNRLGRFWPKDTFVQAPPAIDRPDFTSSEDIRRAMNRLGVDKVCLIGQQMLNIGNIQADDQRPIKYSQAYMAHLMDNIADPDDGIYVTIPVIHSDPDAAVELIERWGDEEAVVGTCIVAQAAEPPFGNRKYDPIYRICEDKDLPVIYHSGGSSIEHYHKKGFQTTAETTILGFLVTIMDQITSIVIQGVPEKFPDLDLVFEEAGLFYIPMMMYRMDQVYLRKPNEAPLLNKLPSEYMKEFYYGTQPLEVVPDDRYLESIIEMIGGPERLLFATDWPHDDHDEVNAITDLPFLSEIEKEQILGKNAERVFGI
jgi:predicted TIM-barrel fold metal-dependent hydrolase